MRPKQVIIADRNDQILESIGGALLLILIGYPLLYYADIPTEIPLHFDFNGYADRHGNKQNLLVLVGAGVMIYTVLTILQFKPHLLNYAVKITPKNAKHQYTLAVKLLRVLKILVVTIFTFLMVAVIRISKGDQEKLGPVFLPFILLLTFGILGYYLYKSVCER